MIYRGKVFKFKDDVNTDLIISGRYKFAITDMKVLSQHLFEDIRPGFYQEIFPNRSIIVSGYNFGMGSSREQAPWVIKKAGILCVVAKSFARIFYRNAFNIGLGLIETDTDRISEKDELEIDLRKGIIKGRNKKIEIKFSPWNNFQTDLIRFGGIIRYLEKNKGFNI